MTTEKNWLDLPEARRAIAASDFGTLLRVARTAKSWTLAEAGRRCGYSAATLSRIERGRQPLLDVALLRRLCGVFDIPPEHFGLATRAESVALPVPIDRVRGRTAQADGEGAVRRRDLLGGVVGVAGFGLSDGAAASLRPQVLRPDDLLLGTPLDGATVGPAELRAALTAARSDFVACRFQQLSARLPRLIAQARTNRDRAGSDNTALASTQLAQAYGIATALLLKLHDDVLAWSSADRGLQAAQASGDPVTLAEASRLTATVMRRTPHRDGAQQFVLTAAERLERDTGLSDQRESAMYVRLLSAAAYTAALHDKRDAAWALLREADEATERTGGPQALALDLAVYRVSVARVLGDFGSAVDFAKRVDPTRIKIPERRARYWEDTALACFGRGRPSAAFQALQIAERDTPQEVRFRPWAQQLVGDLLSGDTRGALPGIREFAARVGA
ncbi:Transcriptional regulator, contains XRE-family HTH domain [Asanoa hainanensis]|uniref:Transcriptional regulator, contains XRE-family HTH domain n=1 Tax=Asanoa hainanensis TaxID=560556 RepID=A0A239NBI3_9ACTN|nr:helix-turn-helix transcriptional regulator [Asanoa hainanensis]SNT51539.1 Transcriptional regulator, contains XRE-family HTH domain [Asanoa hainanensis]